MIARLTLVPTMVCATAMAGIRSGKAVAHWLVESATCEAGRPMKTAILLIHDSGWHSYWINPGEAGVKTSVSWKLPPGWKSGGLGFPNPRRFTTSDLVGFGYEGEVLFPVTVTPPEDFNGNARLSAEISWLACGEQGCVPGKAEIHLDLSAGAFKPVTEAKEIQDAYLKLPRPAGNSPQLAVTEKDKQLILTIQTAPGEIFDPEGREFFPATPDMVDPRTPIRFLKTNERWTAEVTKSEYAASPVKMLSLVAGPFGRHEPIELSWTAP